MLTTKPRCARQKRAGSSRSSSSSSVRHLEWPSKPCVTTLNDALVDGRVADLRLIHQQQAVLRLDDKLCGLCNAAGALRRLEQLQQRIELRFDRRFTRGTGSAARDAPAHTLQGLAPRACDRRASAGSRRRSHRRRAPRTGHTQWQTQTAAGATSSWPAGLRRRSITRWITAKPSSPGICTSRKTRSG